MNLLIRIMIYGSTLLTYATAICLWPESNNGYGNRYCPDGSHVYEVPCVATVENIKNNIYYCTEQRNSNNDYNKIKYNIKINLVNSNENPILENTTYITQLTIQKGYLVTIPNNIFYMSQLTDLTITANKLRKINFNNFLLLQNLKKIDISNNTIIVIEAIEQSSEYSTIQDIDISFNFIEAVPNNFIKRFKELEHLNMSHNLISSIDKHAFEGTVQLKTLDLSYNNIQEVGNIFVQLPKLIDDNSATTKNLQKLSQLVLDYNLITKINFTEFFDTGIPELSIGGNQIPCSELARVKYSKFSEKFNRIVIALDLIFYTDNVNGISCEEVKNDVKDVFIVSEEKKSNSSVLISFLKNAIENNSKSIDSLVGSVNQNEKKLEQFIDTNNLMLSNILSQLADIKNNLPFRAPELFMEN